MNIGAPWLARGEANVGLSGDLVKRLAGAREVDGRVEVNEDGREQLGAETVHCARVRTTHPAIFVVGGQAVRGER
jgi:hypothetical protein